MSEDYEAEESVWAGEYVKRVVAADRSIIGSSLTAVSNRNKLWRLFHNSNTKLDFQVEATYLGFKPEEITLYLLSWADKQD